MTSEKFEMILNRAVVVGGLGSFVPFWILFYWLGSDRIQRPHLYYTIILFLLALWLVNSTRGLVQKSASGSASIGRKYLTAVQILSVICSFLIGAILSLGFVLTFQLFFRR